MFLKSVGRSNITKNDGENFFIIKYNEKAAEEFKV
jgi:hypothetical protein